MNALDQIFGWLMIAFGVAHRVTSFSVQSARHLSLLLSGTAVAIIVGWSLNAWLFPTSPKLSAHEECRWSCPGATLQP
jgi:uncharacterized membrane protein HdeD (DUF308 family)